MPEPTAISPRPVATIGFVGLGVMGGPMCANLVARGGWPVVAFDKEPERCAEAAAAGARIAAETDTLAIIAAAANNPGPEQSGR